MEKGEGRRERGCWLKRVERRLHCAHDALWRGPLLLKLVRIGMTRGCGVIIGSSEDVLVGLYSSR